MRYKMFRIGTLIAVLAVVAPAAVSNRYIRSERRDQERRHTARYCETCERTPSGRIKRNSAARRAFRLFNPCPADGSITGACRGYVIDHIVPLKRGGADDPGNMQWQTVGEAKAKDRWE